MRTKLRKTYNILIRASIIVLTFAFIYDQLFYEKDLISILEFIPTHPNANFFIWIILITASLVPLNLMSEVLKWRLLISKLEKVSMWDAIKAILTGVSVSMFLPNRVGDYLGRVFILKKADRLQAVLSTILGSVSQLLTTVIFGLMAFLLFFPSYFDISINLYKWFFTGISITTPITVGALVFFFLQFSALTPILKKLSGKYYKKIKKYTQVFSWYSAGDLVKVLLLSIGRYIIFSFQFYLLLLAFNIPVSYFESMVLVSLVYLMMTVIPTVALTELGVRSSVSIFVFQLYLSHHNLWTEDIGLGVAAASSILWLLNLAIPALLGTVFVYSLRFFRKNNGINI